MSNDEHPTDRTLTWELRDSLAELAVPGRPPLAAITTRGRAHQRRRLAGFAGLSVTGAAACAALALALTGTIGTAAAARGTGAIRPATRALGTESTGTTTTAAFTLTRNANGTDTLTLTHSQMFNPAALQQALTRHGIPALVKTGAYCWSTPPAPGPGSLDAVGLGVLTLRPPVRPSGERTVKVPSGQLPSPSTRNWIADHTVTVINPAAMPAGTELFFGYSGSAQALYTDLVYINSHTCSSSPPSATR